MENNYTEIGRIRDILREYIPKRIYFIISITVTSIGFAIYNSKGNSFDDYDWFMVIAVTLWGLSVFSGIVSTRIFGNIMKKQGGIKSYQDSVIVNEEVDGLNSKMELYVMAQEFLFYFAVLIYFIGHLFKMGIINYFT